MPHLSAMADPTGDAVNWRSGIVEGAIAEPPEDIPGAKEPDDTARAILECGIKAQLPEGRQRKELL